MKALTIDRYGGPEVVSVRDMPAPEVGDDDVLIDVHAAGLNPIDFKLREGKLKAIRKFKMPLILGNELSGVVKAVGKNVKDFAPGDEVFSRVNKNRMGAFAEQVAVEAQFVAKKPKNLGHVEAATIPLVGLTSWQALVDIAGMKAGHKVLVHAGAGGVGTMAIQLCKQLGAEVATTASARNHELVKKLGADVVIDYTKQDFAKELSGYDIVYDTLGGESLEKSFSVLKPGGFVVSISAIPDLPTAEELGLNPLIKLALRFLNRKYQALCKKYGVRYRFMFMHADGKQLAQLGAYYESGKIVPIVDRKFPLSDGGEALKYLETGRARGKVILEVRNS